MDLCLKIIPQLSTKTIQLQSRIVIGVLDATRNPRRRFGLESVMVEPLGRGETSRPVQFQDVQVMAGILKNDPRGQTALSGNTESELSVLSRLQLDAGTRFYLLQDGTGTGLAFMIKDGLFNKGSAVIVDKERIALQRYSEGDILEAFSKMTRLLDRRV